MDSRIDNSITMVEVSKERATCAPGPSSLKKVQKNLDCQEMLIQQSIIPGTKMYPN